VETVADPLTLLQRAGAAISEQGKGHRLVIGVDDAHLLDELSVTLLHQLALTRTACVVLTVRSGEPAPDPVVTLWKNGLADRLELAQLPRMAMNRLVTGVLGGVVDSRTIERLWRATRGNVLFLRELVEGGCETGALRMRDGVWRWEGRMEPTPRLREIVQAQLGGLGGDERTALELLATDEPLGLGRVASLINPEVVAVISFPRPTPVSCAAGSPTLTCPGNARMTCFGLACCSWTATSPGHMPACWPTPRCTPTPCSITTTPPAWRRRRSTAAMAGTECVHTWPW
jgi:hypothetical protein